MIKKLLLLLCFFSTCTTWSQSGDLPVSWGYDSIDTGNSIYLQPLDLTQIYAEDAVNDLDKSMPWRYGIERNISIDTQTQGKWTVLENEDRIWTVEIESKGAVNISVNFSELDLPEGASIFIYNNERTDVTRSFSKENTRTLAPVASWFVTGDKIIIEYHEPSNIQADPVIKIESVIHGYRMGNLLSEITTRGLNNSGSCNYDVNCNIGDDFEVKKNMLKKAVAMLNLGNGFLCSASLVNNLEQDKKPYLLTANHCLEGSDPALWVVRFNWMNPNPVCATDEDSEAIESNFTVSGATLRSSNVESDFALVELNNFIPDAWDVAFAGWDARDVLPAYSVGIHHPQGDVMKICRDNTGAVKETANGTEVWLIGGQSAGVGDGWEIGTTESGSSGSPLFNENGFIIGQLHGGASFCSDFENNNEFDVYGRFGVAWDSGATPQERLKDWLDPLDQGQLVLEGLQNNLSTTDIQIEGALEIYPNPVSNTLSVVNTRYPNLKYSFYTATGSVILDGNLTNSMNTIDTSQLANGIYFLMLLDEDSQSSSTRKIVVSH